MSKAKIFVDEWNEIVEYKIRESDLKSPTYDFFFSALNSFLRAVNENTELWHKKIPEDDQERIYYIRFCNGINRYLKLFTDVILYFTDLTNPSK